MKLFLAEMAAGEPSDLIGQNQHIEQSSVYHDLGRRSKAQVSIPLAFEKTNAHKIILRL